MKYWSREKLSISDVPAPPACSVLGLHCLTSGFLAKLLSLKTSGRVNIISLNFLPYAVFKLVSEENSCVGKKKKLRTFIGTDMKWASTYIKRINYTKIYARAHYRQHTEMFPKINKRKDYALWGSEESGIKENKLQQSEPGVSRASHLPRRRAEPAWSRPPAPGSRSTSRSASAPRSGSCCSTCARPQLHTCLASLGAGLINPEVRDGEKGKHQCREKETGCAALQDNESPQRQLKSQECKEAKPA